jgi:hypothetical protein
MDADGKAGGDGDARYDTVTAAEAGEAERPGEVDRAAEIVASMADASLLRSVAAVIVGFVVLTLGSVAAGRLIVSATGILPADPITNGFLFSNLGSRLFVAVVAGYLTSRAAPGKPLLHGAALAGMVAFLAAVALMGLRAAGTVEDQGWYPVAMLFVGPIGVLLGAAIGEGRIARRATLSGPPPA